MSYLDRAVAFDCAGEILYGVLSFPSEACDIGVVVVVGGPQYRVGSHRQFVLLARQLAEAGFPVLRFDVRGMGDASGDFPGFENIGPDIAAAIATLRSQAPIVRRVILWGLCDAASAALLSPLALAETDGLVLLNPWVRNAETLARTEVKVYYHRRFLDPAFWQKLARGEVNVLSSLREFLGKLGRQFIKPNSLAENVAEAKDFRERMVQGFNAFGGPVLLILSGRDLVAAEFLEFCRRHPALQDICSRPQMTRLDLAQADHTFSTSKHRGDVAEATRHWLDTVLGRDIS